MYFNLPVLCSILSDDGLAARCFRALGLAQIRSPAVARRAPLKDTFVGGRGLAKGQAAVGRLDIPLYRVATAYKGAHWQNAGVL